MYFVGVDLAWAGRNPTGLAVLDDSGRLVHLGSVTTDDEIVDGLSPYTAARVLVAFDAPLVVGNTSGNRPAEAMLNRDFGRFDAGAHPSNTARSEFHEMPRGARLAELLGLDIDPDAGARRRAVEVYPHPATVALFRLGRTLKYKNRPGRTLSDLRDELLHLVRLLEGLADAPTAMDLGVPAWHALVASIEAAPRKVDLRRAEDQVDAVVCAYVALIAQRRPAEVTTYGDLATGFIVTPTLPPDLVPTKRSKGQAPAIDAAAPTGSAVSVYAARHEDLTRAAELFTRLVTDVVDEAGINYLNITSRTKSVASFAEKAERRNADGAPVYADPLTEITDQLGIRVVAYLSSDVAAVAEALEDQVVVHGDRDMGQETASEGRFGYASRHLLISLDGTAPVATEYQPLLGLSAQVQIRTVLQHAWAQFEHEVRYKGQVPAEYAPDLDRRFTLAAGLLELADREFSSIRDRLQVGMGGISGDSADGDPRISGREMAAFLAGQYTDAAWSRTDHYSWISTLVLELGIGSLAELSGVLRDVDDEEILRRMDYRYPPGAVRRLDDALLWVFGDRYLRLSGNAHRVESLTARLDRLHPSGKVHPPASRS